MKPETEASSRAAKGTHLAKGKGFTQVKKEFWYPVLESVAQSPAAMRILCWCLGHMNKANQVYARQSEIMAALKLTRKSIHNGLKTLQSARLVLVERGCITLSEQTFWEGREPVKPYFQKIISDPVIPEKILRPAAKVVKSNKLKAIR